MPRCPGFCWTNPASIPEISCCNVTAVTANRLTVIHHFSIYGVKSKMLPHVASHIVWCIDCRFSKACWFPPFCANENLFGCISPLSSFLSITGAERLRHRHLWLQQRGVKPECRLTLKVALTSHFWWWHQFDMQATSLWGSVTSQGYDSYWINAWWRLASIETAPQEHCYVHSCPASQVVKA